MATRKPAVSAPSDEEISLISKIGVAWRDIRRGGVNGPLRDRVYGTNKDSLDPRQMDVLDLLVEPGTPRRMGDLAANLRIDPSTATRAIQRLIRDGLATKVKVPGDARAVHITVTAKGRRVHSQVFARRREMLLELVRAVDPRQRGTLVENLQLFVDTIEKITPQSGTRTK